MASNLEKKTIINMENTASYQTRSKLNIAFSTADRESAVFVFNITKGSKPLLLSSENVTGHIALKHNDGSFVKDTLHFTEPDINGRLEYYIPNEMLKRQGTVTMQVFITEKGNSNVTVAERIVSFDIQESIVSQISAETKLQYIVEYDELQAIIANRITDIEDNMANAEDYVSQLEQAREKGLTDIEIAKTDNIKTLNDLADIRLEEMNSKASEYSRKFDADKQYMDEKHESFKESVLNSEVVTQGESEDWQKSKLIGDNGSLESVPYIDLNNPEELLSKTCFVYISTSTNRPANTPANGYLSFYRRTNDYMKMEYKPYNSDRVYHRTKFNGTWSDWKEIVTLSPDEEVETKNSAESRANETLTDANQYTTEKINNQHGVLFEGSANGVGTSIKLTDDYTKYKMLFISGSFGGGDFTQEYSTYLSAKIVIQKTNVSDAAGDGGGHHELVIEKINNTELKITNDVFHDFGVNKGSGPDANRFTIKYIEGWK